MKVVIMGCGRVGAELASTLDRAGHTVTIIDINPEAFRRLPSSFGGRKLVGNGIDQDVLRRACAGKPDAFVAVTQGDNRNVMSAQIAKHILNIPKVVCRIYDPIREEIYRDLGLETISPTRVGARLLMDALEKQPAPSKAGE
ncbi:MAG TPA: TrkA family potassium uptake protein [Dehalococcoidia bacterium]|nr:TrkA family potassium uptake protein [Dehalococcoidia bacterium]